MDSGLHHAQSVKGIWWKAGQDIKQNAEGDLSFKPYKGLRLETTGSIPEFDADGDDCANLMGLTRDGKKLTILGARGLGSVRSWPGITVGRFHSLLAIVGEHVDDDDPIFAASKVQFSGMREWWDPPLSDSNWIETIGQPVETDLKLKAPTTQELDVPHGQFKLEITAGPRGNVGRYALNFESVVSLRIIPSEEKPLSWHREVVRKVRLLMWLLQGGRVTLDQLHVSGPQETGPDKKLRWRFHEVLSGHERLESEEAQNRLLMAIKPEALGDSLGAVIDKWFKDYDTIRPLIDLYFAHAEKPDLYLQFQVFSMVAGLEGYHRNVVGGGYMDEPTWKPHRRAIRKAFPEALSGDHRQALQDLLSHAYQFPLDHRLRHLIEQQGQGARRFFTNDVEEFVGTAKRARNYMAHYKAGAVSADDTFRAARQLEALCIATLWKHVGISDGLIEEGLTNMRMPDWTVKDEED